MKKIAFIAALIPILLIAGNIPDIYEYYPISGDKFDIYLVDKTTLRSYNYETAVEYDNSVIIKVLDKEQQAPSNDMEDNGAPEFIPWNLIDVDGKTLKEVSLEINKLYKDEFDIDTVYVTIKHFSGMNNVAVSIGSGKTNYVRFDWGKTYRYYMNYVEARILATEPTDIYVIHKNSKDYDFVDLDDIAMPQDQIFLYPSLINVGGYVNMPSVYPYAPGFTIMDYIGLAGGVAQYGSLSKVHVFDENGHKINRNEEIKPGYSISVGKSFMGIMTDVSVIVSILLGVYSVYSITTSLVQ